MAICAYREAGEHISRTVFSAPSWSTYYSEGFFRDVKSVLKILSTEVLVLEQQVRAIR